MDKNVRGDVAEGSDTGQREEDMLGFWREAGRLADSFAHAKAAVEEDKILDMFITAARNIVRADGACIILREGDFVYYAKEDSVAPLWAGRRFPVANCISGWSINNGIAAVVPDIYR